MIRSYKHRNAGILSIAAAAAAATIFTLKAQAQASPAITTPLQLEVNPVTGDVELNFNGAFNVADFVIESAGGSLVPSATFNASFLSLFPNYASDSSTNLNPFTLATNGVNYSGLLDIGSFYNVTSTADLFFAYGEKGVSGGALQRGNVDYVGVGVTGIYGMWDGFSGNWSNAMLWDTGVVPSGGSAIVQVSPVNIARSTITLDQNAAVGSVTTPITWTFAISTGQTLNLSSTGVSSVGTLINNGALVLQNGTFTTVGGSGSGSFTLSNGASLTFNGSYISTSSQNWGAGTVNQASSMDVIGSETVGSPTGGSFIQTGQFHTVTASLNIAANAGDSGAYTLNGPLAAITAPGTVNVGGSASGAGGSGTFNLQNGTASIGTLKIWDTAGTSFNMSGGTLNYQTLDVSGNPSRFNWTGGTIQFSGSNSLPLSTIPSAGSLLLSPTSTNVQVSGPTGGILNNGTIKLDKGSFTAQLNSDVTNNGNILFQGGSRKIAGNVTSNGVITAGDAISTLSVNSLTLNPQSELSFNLATPGVSSKVNVLNSGALDIVGTTSLVLQNSGGMTYGTYALLDYNGSFSGSLSNLAIASAPSGFFYTLSNDTTSDAIDLTVGTSGVSGTGSAQLWLGGTGNYSSASNWAGGVVPAGIDKNLELDGGNAVASVVTVDQDATVGTVSLDPDDTLVINSGHTLTLGVAVTSAFNGSVSNNGNINLPIGNASFAKGIGGSGNLSIGGGSNTLTVGANSLTQTSVTVGANSTLNLGAPTVYGPGKVVTGGGLTTPVNISGALAVTNGGVVNFNATTTGNGQIHTVGSLYISNGSQVDIGNHTLIIQNVPDESAIEIYVNQTHPRNDPNPNLGIITSSTVSNDTTGTLAIGYGSAADFAGTPSPYAAGGATPLTGNQTVIKPALAGDLFLQGKVGFVDLSVALNFYDPSVIQGPYPANWSRGNVDRNPNNIVDLKSLALIQQNFGKSLGGASTLVATPTLTGARPTVLSAAPTAASDAIDLVVDPTTGDVQLNGNNAQSVMAIDIVSSNGNLIASNPVSAGASSMLPSSASDSNSEIALFNTSTNGVSINSLVDLGDLYNTLGDTSDLTFEYTERGVNNGLPLAGSVFAVSNSPEPTSLSLMALAAGGFLTRRRRKADTR